MGTYSIAQETIFSVFNNLSYKGFPCSSVSKEFACSARDPSSIPGLGRSPGEANGNPLQYPCVENLLDRGTWWIAVHGVAKSRARLSDSTQAHTMKIHWGKL